MSESHQRTEPEDCPFLPVIDLIGGRWKSEIYWHLNTGPYRFNQMRRLLAGITPKMLTQQLREMERDGLICRTQYNEIPPRVEYSLTSSGDSLKPVFGVIAEWGQRHLPAVRKARSKYDRAARRKRAIVTG